MAYPQTGELRIPVASEIQDSKVFFSDLMHRRPERTVLHRIVQMQLAAWLDSGRPGIQKLCCQ